MLIVMPTRGESISPFSSFLCQLLTRQPAMEQQWTIFSN